jgi:hypothetical protein
MARDIVLTARHARPQLGHISRPAHVLAYVLLLSMITVDYILLSQALTLLLRNDSQYGSIGAQMYVITLGISLAVVVLPHLIAIVMRRIQGGLMSRRWSIAALVLAVVWCALLAAITLARIKAGIDSQNASGLTGLVGAGSTAPAAGFSWTAPDTIMAFLMLGLLATSGAVSFLIAWLTSRPLLGASEKADAQVDELRLQRDRLLAEAVSAREATLQAERLDQEDAARYTGARIIFAARVDAVRAQLATRLAQKARDPESTSQIIRELRARRMTEQAEVSAAIPPAQLSDWPGLERTS